MLKLIRIAKRFCQIPIPPYIIDIMDSPTQLAKAVLVLVPPHGQHSLKATLRLPSIQHRHLTPGSLLIKRNKLVQHSFLEKQFVNRGSSFRVLGKRKGWKLSSWHPMLKAREDLHHGSVVDAKGEMNQTIKYQRDKQARSLESPHVFYSCSVIFGMLALFACAFIPVPLLGPFEWLRSFYLFFFRSVKALQVLFITTCVVHIGEAVFAFFLAQKVDSANAVGWFWQTLALGYGSLMLILKRSQAKGSSIE